LLQAVFTPLVWKNNKQEAKKKSTRNGTRRLEKFSSMMEHLGVYLELEIEEPGCQA
jgi:hypothetical protein